MEVEGFPETLPTGFRGKSNHHLANFSTWQIDKLANILLFLIGLLKRNTIGKYVKIPFQVFLLKLSQTWGSCLASKINIWNYTYIGFIQGNILFGILIAHSGERHLWVQEEEPATDMGERLALALPLHMTWSRTRTEIWKSGGILV